MPKNPAPPTQGKSGKLNPTLANIRNKKIKKLVSIVQRSLVPLPADNCSAGANCPLPCLEELTCVVTGRSASQKSQGVQGAQRLVAHGQEGFPHCDKRSQIQT
eukprot:206184-Rhodomonas_salina.3